MNKEKETALILQTVEAAMAEFKADTGLHRVSSQLMMFSEFKEIFEYETAGRTEYEKAIAYSFYVSLVTNKKLINRIRKKYGSGISINEQPTRIKNEKNKIDPTDDQRYLAL